MADKQPGNLIPDIYGVSQPNQGQQSFVPQTDFGNAPSYEGTSKGTQKVAADTSKGTALENIGKGLTDAVEVTKNYYKNKIEDNLNSGIAQARADQDDRIDSAFNRLQNGPDVFAQGTATKPAQRIPTGVDRFGDAIGTAQEQYDQGVLTNSMYHGQLEQLVSQAKAAYPGFTDEIDQMIKDKTGIIPAEALRRDRLADLNALERAKAGAASKDETYFQTNAKYLGVDAGAWTNRVRADPGLLPRAITLIHQAQGVEFAMQAAKDKTAYDSTRAEGEFQSYADTYVRQALGRKSSGADMSFQDIQKATTAMRASGETMDSKTVMHLVNEAQITRNAIEAELTNKLTQPNEQGVSWQRSINSPEKSAAILKNSLALVDSQLNDLISGNHDIAHLNKVMNETANDQLTKEIIAKYPVYGTLAVAKNQGGDFLVNQAISTATGKQLSQLTTQISGGIFYNSVYQPNVSLADDLGKAKELAKTPTAKAEVVNNVLAGHVAMITAKDGLPDEKAKVAHRMFTDPELLNKNFNEGQPRQTWYNRLGSEEMVNSVKALSTTHPEVLGEYTKFMHDNFAGIIHQNAAELNQIISKGDVQLRYDPQMNQVQYKIPPAQRNPTQLSVQQNDTYRVESILGPLNTTLRSAGNVLKLDKANVGEELDKSLRGEGVFLGMDWSSQPEPLENRIQSTVKSKARKAAETVRDLFTQKIQDRAVSGAPQ